MPAGEEQLDVREVREDVWAERVEDAPTAAAARRAAQADEAADSAHDERRGEGEQQREFSVSHGLRVSQYAGMAEDSRQDVRFRVGQRRLVRKENLASKRWSGSTTSVRATHETFQMLNWPSASVGAVRPSRPSPVTSGHVITIASARPARAATKTSRGRAMVPGGSSM